MKRDSIAVRPASWKGSNPDGPNFSSIGRMKLILLQKPACAFDCGPQDGIDVHPYSIFYIALHNGALLQSHEHTHTSK